MVRKKLKKILFVAWDPSVTWVHTDIEILKKEFNVKVLKCTSFLDLLKIIYYINYVDVSFNWFGGKDAALTVLISKLLRKKAVVVAGGVDAAFVPEIGYGMAFDPIKRFLAQFSFQHADYVLTVSESTKNELLNNYRVNPEKVIVVYLGFDHEKYKPIGVKENLVLTIGGVNKTNLSKKGIETFVKTSNYLESVNFVLVGKTEKNSISYLKTIAGSNITFTGYVSEKELLNFMQRARVYVQISAHESFGSSLAEAMLCEAIPVVTKRGAIPEVVGNTGLYVPYNDPEATAYAIVNAFRSPNGRDSRNRIIELFSYTKREIILHNLIKKILK